MDWERVVAIRDHYLWLYSHYEPFLRAIESFYREECDPIHGELANEVGPDLVLLNTQRHLRDYRWVNRYIAASREFCVKYGLGLITDHISGTNSKNTELIAGQEILHIWCSMKASMQTGDREFPAMHFFTAAGGGGGGIPDIEGPKTSRTVKILLDDYWDPTIEPPKQAEERLLGELKRQLTARLQEIVNSAETVGYKFNKTTNLLRDIEWLFWHNVERLSYTEIVHRRNIGLQPDQRPDYKKRPEQLERDRDAVRQAIRRLSRRSGILTRRS